MDVEEIEQSFYSDFLASLIAASAAFEAGGVEGFNEAYNSGVLADESAWEDSHLLAAFLLGFNDGANDLEFVSDSDLNVFGNDSMIEIKRLNAESYESFKIDFLQFLQEKDALLSSGELTTEEAIESVLNRAGNQAELVASNSVFNSERAGVTELAALAVAADMIVNVYRQTRGDDRVRPLHARYNNVVTSNATFESVQRADGFGCRCRKRLTTNKIEAKMKNVFNVKASGSSYYLSINGDIGDQVTADSVKAELSEIPENARVNVLIDSLGGSVTHGLIIYDELKKLGDRVVTTVTKHAASMGSIIAMAGSVIEINEDAMFMIHNPYIEGARGDADELQGAVDQMRAYESIFLDIYSGRMNVSREDIVDLLKEETTFTAYEAVRIGLADKISSNHRLYAKVSKEDIEKAPKELLKSIRQTEGERVKLEEALAKLAETEALRDAQAEEINELTGELKAYREVEAAELEEVITAAASATGKDTEFFKGMSKDTINEIAALSSTEFKMKGKFKQEKEVLNTESLIDISKFKI